MADVTHFVGNEVVDVPTFCGVVQDEMAIRSAFRDHEYRPPAATDGRIGTDHDRLAGGPLDVSKQFLCDWQEPR